MSGSEWHLNDYKLLNFDEDAFASGNCSPLMGFLGREKRTEGDSLEEQ